MIQIPSNPTNALFLSLKILLTEYVYMTEIKHIYVKATWSGYQFFSERILICKS